MQIEVLRGEPGTLAFDVNGDLFGCASVVYTLSSDAIFAGAHAVPIVGWGKDLETGLDYCVVQNSPRAG